MNRIYLPITVNRNFQPTHVAHLCYTPSGVSLQLVDSRGIQPSAISPRGSPGAVSPRSKQASPLSPKERLLAGNSPATVTDTITTAVATSNSIPAPVSTPASSSASSPETTCVVESSESPVQALPAIPPQVAGPTLAEIQQQILSEASTGDSIGATADTASTPTGEAGVQTSPSELVSPRRRVYSFTKMMEFRENYAIQDAPSGIPQEVLYTPPAPSTRCRVTGRHAIDKIYQMIDYDIVVYKSINAGAFGSTVRLNKYIAVRISRADSNPPDIIDRADQNGNIWHYEQQQKYAGLLSPQKSVTRLFLAEIVYSGILPRDACVSGKLQSVCNPSPDTAYFIPAKNGRALLGMIQRYQKFFADVKPLTSPLALRSEPPGACSTSSPLGALRTKRTTRPRRTTSVPTPTGVVNTP